MPCGLFKYVHFGVTFDDALGVEGVVAVIENQLSSNASRFTPLCRYQEGPLRLAKLFKLRCIHKQLFHEVSVV